MSDPQGLVPWLREQIAEQRAAALAARAEWGDEDGDRDSDWEEWRLSLKLADAGWFDPEPRGLDRHWQLHSPRAVLAQCEAHEAILDLHPRVVALDSRMSDWCGECSGEERSVAFPCPTVRAVALAYRHRPGYREEWRP